MSADLDDLTPGDAAVWEPVDGCEIEAHGLADDDAGATLFLCEATTDGGMLASMRTLELVGATSAAFYVADIDGRPAARIHDKIHDAIESSGGVIVDDASEVPQ